MQGHSSCLALGSGDAGWLCWVIPGSSAHPLADIFGEAGMAGLAHLQLLRQVVLLLLRCCNLRQGRLEVYPQPADHSMSPLAGKGQQNPFCILRACRSCEGPHRVQSNFQGKWTACRVGMHNSNSQMRTVPCQSARQQHVQPHSPGCAAAAPGCRTPRSLPCSPAHPQQPSPVCSAQKAKCISQSHCVATMWQTGAVSAAMNLLMAHNALMGQISSARLHAAMCC